MKKISILLGATLGLFALASCQKEVDVNIPENDNAIKHIPFELKADVPETRTTLDAQTWEMAWEAGDVIYAVTTDAEWGAPYSSENPNLESIAEFTYSNGGFSTTSTISDGKHTFNFLYTAGNQKSYHRGAGTTFQLYSSQTMDASAPTANLKNYDALAGQVTATTPTTFVNVPMNHLFTLMKVTLNNKTGDDITATKFEISAEDAYLYGVYNVSFDNTPTATYSKNGGDKITVNINNGTIANNGTLDVYFVMAPLSNYSGDITFTATDSDGAEYTKTNTVSGVTFDAGKYNTASFSLKPVEKPIYSTSFDYTLVGDYQSATPVSGSDGEGTITSWEIVYGNWNGNNCAQMRVYNAGKFGYLYNTFDCSGVTHITYSAKVNNTALKLNTYYSTDKGASWTKVDDAKELTTSLADYSFAISETGAYGRVRIKFEVTGTKPSSGNYQLTIDDVKIWGNGQVLEDRVISAENITDVPVGGVENATANYTVNFTDDVKVTSTTGCVSEATASQGTITYSVAPNYTTSAKTGTIVLASESDPSTTKTINVSQKASSGLSVSSTSVTIPVDAQSNTFTLTTADYGWNAEVTPAEGVTSLSISPSSGSASSNAQTITVTSNVEATSSIQTLGTIVIYRNGNTSDSQKKVITVEKAATQAQGTITATILFGNGKNGTTSINSASVTGNDDQGNTWTVTTVGTTSFTPNSGYSQVGSSSKPATSITFTTTLPETVSKVNSLSIKCGGFSGTAGTVTMKVGDTTVGTGSLNGTNDVTVESSSSANGRAITITITDIDKGVKIYNIIANYQ